MEFRYLADVHFVSIYHAFINAFSDYLIPMHLSETQLRELFERRGAAPELSVGAFDKEELVGFNWNALDVYNGALSVYDVATGVIPSHRGKGIAKELFYFSLPLLKQTGARRYVLEVFENNQRAVGLYEKIGFRKVRTLECFRNLSPRLAVLSSDLRIAPIEADWSTFSVFWDWQPSWQNSIRSLERSKGEKQIYGAFHNGELVGYGIVYPKTGDIPQLAVSRKYRRQGAGSALLNELQSVIVPGTIAKLINIDASDRGSVEFLLRDGFERFVVQYEMHMSFGAPARLSQNAEGARTSSPHWSFYI